MDIRPRSYRACIYPSIGILEKVMIDPQKWHELEYQELGPLHIDQESGQVVQLTREAAEELRHVESIPFSRPDRPDLLAKAKIVVNPIGGGQFQSGSIRTQLQAHTLQVFNGTAWTMYFSTDESAYGVQDVSAYDFYVPQYYAAVLKVEADYFTYYMSPPGGGSALVEFATVYAWHSSIMPQMGYVGKGT